MSEVCGATLMVVGVLLAWWGTRRTLVFITITDMEACTFASWVRVGLEVQIGGPNGPRLTIHERDPALCETTLRRLR